MNTPSNSSAPQKILSPTQRPVRPLSAVEQYIYTNGACQIFVAAARQLIGGEPTVLIATDPRQLLEHDTREPLEIHIYLTLADGRVLDAEGLRSQEELLRSFGVRDGYSYEIRKNQDIAALGRANPDLVAALQVRLEDLNWSDVRLPKANNLLGGQAVYRKAAEDSRNWWPRWTSSWELPDGEAESNAKAWGWIGPDTLELGENPFHYMAHIPDMIHVNLIEKASGNDNHFDAYCQLLGTPRFVGLSTPLHAICEHFSSKDANRWGFELVMPQMIEILLNSGRMDLFERIDKNGNSVAKMLLETRASLAPEHVRALTACMEQLDMELKTAMVDRVRVKGALRL